MDKMIEDLKPGDPYPFQGEKNPSRNCAGSGHPSRRMPRRWAWTASSRPSTISRDEAFLAGTTSIQAADAEGWVVSVTPSGGWIPAFIAGNSGVG
jgi:gamma-glutamyltranspeptidase / glutathione hydrolase